MGSVRNEKLGGAVGAQGMADPVFLAELKTTFGICITAEEIPTLRTLDEVWEAMERRAAVSLVSDEFCE